MARKDIQSRRDATTRDVQPERNTEREYRFPALGVTVQATTYQEALSKVKKQVSK